MKLSFKPFITPIVAILCIAGVGFIQVPQMRRLTRTATNVSPASLEKQVESERLRLQLLRKVPAFGFDNLFANLVYLNFIQYFGDDEARSLTGYSLSPEFFEIILNHDPRFLEAYLGLSVSTSLYAGMPDRTISLMNKHIKSLSPQLPPKSYYVWRYKGTDELLFLGDAQAAQKSLATAAKWASQYTYDESKVVAQLSQRTADFLARNPQSKSAQINAWIMVLTNQVDNNTRKRAIAEIERLGGKVIFTPEGNARISFPKEE